MKLNRTLIYEIFRCNLTILLFRLCNRSASSLQRIHKGLPKSVVVLNIVNVVREMIDIG